MQFYSTEQALVDNYNRKEEYIDSLIERYGLKIYFEKVEHDGLELLLEELANEKFQDDTKYGIVYQYHAISLNNQLAYVGRCLRTANKHCEIKRHEEHLSEAKELANSFKEEQLMCMLNEGRKLLLEENPESLLDVLNNGELCKKLCDTNQTQFDAAMAINRFGIKLTHRYDTIRLCAIEREKEMIEESSTLFNSEHNNGMSCEFCNKTYQQFRAAKEHILLDTACNKLLKELCKVKIDEQSTYSVDSE